MIPGPRPPKGHDRPSAGRDRGSDDVAPLRPALATEVAGETSDAPLPRPVSLTRTPRGWAVTSPAGIEDAADLIEGLSLADLVAEELGVLHEPDRSARRSVRGPSGASEGDDPTNARIAELERTVAQLEHALAARVSTERAIGILAERHGLSARAAFESLRGDARSQGRPVAQLAREVLDSLSGSTTSPENHPTDGDPLPATRELADAAAVGVADGRS